MRCQTVIEQLSSYFDGELSEALSEEVTLHLAHCESCAQEFSSFERIRGLIVTATQNDFKPPPWAAIAARLDVERNPVTMPLVTLPKDLIGRSPRRSKLQDVLVIVASLAATILIVTLTWQRTKHESNVAHSEHSHQSDSVASASSINFQDTVSLQRQDTRLAMQSLSHQYEGREATPDEVAKNVGYSPIVQSSLTSGVKLVSTQLLKLPECDCAEGECTCGPGECNCVACFCERPDGSSFIVVEQCKGQKVNFGDLPVHLVRRGKHVLQVTDSDNGLAVTWEASKGRLTAFGLRGLDEIDSLLAVN